jgi:hypothetical protein
MREMACGHKLFRVVEVPPDVRVGKLLETVKDEDQHRH